MKRALMQYFIQCYRFLFARRHFLPLNQFLYALSLRGLGVLNFENDRVSGEESFLEDYLGKRNKSTVLDVGANIGRYGEKIMRIQRNARVYAFEPHPFTFKRLQESASKHGFQAFNVGCGSTRGEQMLYDYPDGMGSEHATVHEGVFTRIHDQKPVAHVVKFTTLDDFCREHDLGVIDLLKIDVEGHELAVLHGFRQYLNEGKVNAIHFEFNSMNVVSRVFFKDFFDLLQGYSLYRLLPDGFAALSHYDPVLCEIFAFQNIVALRKKMDGQGQGVV